MSRPAVPVLYIAGTGRSGSTLLASVLGSIDGVFSAGELRFTWERGLAEDAVCGCHRPVAECDVWSSTFNDAFGGFDGPDVEAIRGALAGQTRIRNLPAILRRRGAPDGVPDALKTALPALYRSIQTTTGARLIVDSSKLPTYAMLLSDLDDIDLRIVHLVRDPRAAAWSWMRQGATGAVAGFDEEMDRFSPSKSASLWSLWNGMMSQMWRSNPERYLPVRYEDFAAEPRGVVEQIIAFAGIDNEDAPFSDLATVDLPPNHAIAGNPNRMRHGETSIRTDNEWEHAMPKRDRAAVTTLTAPLLPRFGYRIQP